MSGPEERRRAVDLYSATPMTTAQVCVCSIESGPCERVESLQMSGRF